MVINPVPFSGSDRKKTQKILPKQEYRKIKNNNRLVKHLDAKELAIRPNEKSCRLYGQMYWATILIV